MSRGYDSIKAKQEKEYQNQFNKYLECMYSADSKKIEDFLSGSKLNCEGSLIFDIICNINDSIAPKSFVESEIHRLCNFEFVTSCNLNMESLNIVFNNNPITVSRLDKTIANIKKGNLKTNISNYISETINIAKNIGKNTNIVIGYLTGDLDKLQKFHCWLEFEQNGKKYVIDYPHNIIINKKGYYLLTQPKIIKKINYDSLDRETLDILNNIFKLEYDEIICFYDEYKQELKKKSHW